MSEMIVDIFVLLFQFVIRVFIISDKVVCTVDGIKNVVDVILFIL